MITKLLIEEFNKRNTISLKKFYIRRLLRLYPPILFMVLITLAIPALRQTVRLPELTAALFYYENYFFLRHYEALKNVTSFVFFWSLSVEEHFYLLFPLILMLLIRAPKKLLIVIIALMAAALAARLYATWHYQVNEFSGMYCDLATTCRIDSILIGCFSSVLISTRHGQRYIGVISKTPVFISALAALVFCLLFRNELFRQTIRYSIQNVALMTVIPAILYSPKIRVAKPPVLCQAPGVYRKAKLFPIPFTRGCLCYHRFVCNALWAHVSLFFFQPHVGVFNRVGKLLLCRKAGYETEAKVWVWRDGAGFDNATHKLRRKVA